MKGPITGTFIDEITYDIPSSNWSNQQWKDELVTMKEIGIDTLVFIRGGLGAKTIFPCECLHTTHRDDFAGLILREAAEQNMKVYFGLYISNIDWNGGDVKTEIKLNQPFIKEAYARYGQLPSFEGWYIPHETSKNVLNIDDLMEGLGRLCKECDSSKKVLISPFFESELLAPDNYLTPDQHLEEWQKILKKAGQYIDICAFQDGTAPLNQMSTYYGAVKQLCERFGMSLWVNAETFERDVRCMYYPIPFTDLKQKLTLHEAYAEKIITFEFSHFMSPQSIYPSAHNLFERYKEYYR